MQDVVQAGQESEPNWLVMVYMIAQNVPGEASSLNREAADDIKEITDGIRKHDRVRAAYQLHTDEKVERGFIGKVRPDSAPVPVPQSDAVVSDGTALSKFVLWAVNTAIAEGHRPGIDHTMLVLWGHAYRFGIGASVTHDGVDAIDFSELANRFRSTQSALYASLPDEARQKFPKGRSLKLDILAFDTCDLATVEMAIQMRDFADFMVASQMGVPLPGWPYKDILERLDEPKGRQMAPAELGSYIVRRFCDHYRAEDRAVALSLLNLQRAEPLIQLTENLARELAVSLDGDPDETALTMELFAHAQTVAEKPFVDVANLCLNLLRYSKSEGVRRAAIELGDFLVTPLAAPGDVPRSPLGTNRPFVAEYGRNACEAARLQGISLYAPHVAPDTFDWLEANHWYEKFLFTQQTMWYELVRALALPE